VKNDSTLLGELRFMRHDWTTWRPASQALPWLPLCRCLRQVLRLGAMGVTLSFDTRRSPIAQRLNVEPIGKPKRASVTLFPDSFVTYSPIDHSWLVYASLVPR
jgi:hypothetical protein